MIADKKYLSIPANDIPPTRGLMHKDSKAAEKVNKRDCVTGETLTSLLNTLVAMLNVALDVMASKVNINQFILNNITDN